MYLLCFDMVNKLLSLYLFFALTLDVYYYFPYSMRAWDGDEHEICLRVSVRMHIPDNTAK